MYLKRYYDKPEDWQPAYEGQEAFEAMLQQSALPPAMQDQMRADFRRSARLTNAPPVNGIDVIHTGTHAEQNLSRELVEQALAGGWISMSKGRLTLHTQTQGDIQYDILRMPGTYCCHCDMKLDDDSTGGSGKAHVQAMHAGVASPDKSNPAGFRVTHAYECRLEEGQHARWNGQAVMEAKLSGAAGAGNGARVPPGETQS